MQQPCDPMAWPTPAFEARAPRRLAEGLWWAATADAMSSVVLRWRLEERKASWRPTAGSSPKKLRADARHRDFVGLTRLRAFEAASMRPRRSVGPEHGDSAPPDFPASSGGRLGDLVAIAGRQTRALRGKGPSRSQRAQVVDVDRDGESPLCPFVAEIPPLLSTGNPHAGSG